MKNLHSSTPHAFSLWLYVKPAIVICNANKLLYVSEFELKGIVFSGRKYYYSVFYETSPA
jgi:hypothetical protein